MRFVRAVTAAVIVLSLPIVAGCGAEESLPEHEARSEGLMLTERTAEHVAGTFEREGHRLSFDIRRGTDVLEARISDAEGPLIVSTRRGDVEDIEYLGGRARMHGVVGGEMPKIEGDPNVFDAMNARPAATLIFELKDTLREAGVERRFFTVESDKAQLDVRPASWSDGTYRHLYFNESYDFATWGWSTYTTFQLSAEDKPTSGMLQALTGSAPPDFTGVIYPGWPYYRRLQYWGVLVRITNTMPPSCYPCTNTGLMVTSW